MKNGLKTYKLFLVFVMIGVITTVVSFQTLHFIGEECNEKHYCHESDERKNDAHEGIFHPEEQCPLCELKLPLIAPDEVKDFDELQSVLNFSLDSSYIAPITVTRTDNNLLRAPPRKS